MAHYQVLITHHPLRIRRNSFYTTHHPSIITHPKTVWGIQTPKTLPATYFISPDGEIVFASLKPQDEASLSLVYEDLQNGV